MIYILFHVILLCHMFLFTCFVFFFLLSSFVFDSVYSTVIIYTIHYTLLKTSQYSLYVNIHFDTYVHMCTYMMYNVFYVYVDVSSRYNILLRFTGSVSKPYNNNIILNLLIIMKTNQLGIVNILTMLSLVL